jgi:hypothetical protein
MSNQITRGTGRFGSVATRSLVLGATTIKDLTYGSLSVVHGTILPNRMGTISVALASVNLGDNAIASVINQPADGLALSGVRPIAGTLQVMVANVTPGTIGPGTFSLGVTIVDLT